MNAYAFRNTYDIALKSSSGGAYFGIVDVLYKKYGESVVIYGAAYKEDFAVEHRRVTTIDECEIFCGSKYVQSYLGTTFTDVESDLRNGTIVLFTGTPCQINALKCFLNTKNCSMDKLYLVDLICHGTPSPKLWKEYVSWLEIKENSKLKKFSFRYKGNAEKRMKYPVMAEFENGKKYEDSYYTRMYTQLFFTQLAYRDSCYACKYSSINRVSDVTIGDFWTYEEVMNKREKNSNLGMSLVIVSTDKGQEIVNELEKKSQVDSDVYFEKCDFHKLQSVQTSFGATYKRNDSVDRFRRDYEENGIDFILRKYAGYNVKGYLKHVAKKFATKLDCLTLASRLYHKLVK